MTKITDDQIFDPYDNNDEDDDDFQQIVRTSRRTIRQILTAGRVKTIVTKIEPPEGQPGIVYVNHNENWIDDGKNWISSSAIYDPQNLFALINVGDSRWGNKLYKEYSIGLEEHYHIYGGVGMATDAQAADNQSNSVPDNAGQDIVKLIRFNTKTALELFAQTIFYVPLHHFVPLPISPYDTELFKDSNNAQLWGWCKHFKGSGFSNNEIEGIVNYHRDFDRMNLLFLGDIISQNLAYRYIGGKWEKQWVLHNLKDEEETK